MKTPDTSFAKHSNKAFTLIELLVVIAIIGILAALLFPVGAKIKSNATIKRVKTEVDFVAAAVERYKAEFGHNPPDNANLLPLNDPKRYALNQLFYELIGVKVVTVGANKIFQTEAGANGIDANNIPNFFQSTVTGFVNASSGSGDEARKSKDCIVGIKPGQYLEIQNNGVTGAVLGTSVLGPLMLTNTVNEKVINPFRYDASSTNRNNAKGFDVWVDIIVGGKTNRISNWNDKPDIVP